MKKVILSLFTFNELNKEAQNKALNNLRTINVDYKWWDSTYEDAKTIGLEITAFDLDRNRHAQGNIIGTAEETAKLIKENHGEECNTYKLAETFLTAYYIIDGQLQAETITTSLINELEGAKEDLEIDFKNDLLKEYACILQKESDYLLSDEAIKETIEANEYTFEQDGRMNNSKVEPEIEHKGTEGEVLAWDFVEKHYPDYHTSEKIYKVNQLNMILLDEVDPEDKATEELFKTEYDGSMLKVRVAHDVLCKVIYEVSIVEYLKTV